MSVSIDTVTIGTEDRRFALTSGSGIARYLEVGSSWTRLVIGMRMNVTDTGATITGSPSFGFGLMSNPLANLTNGPLSATCPHFMGVGMNSSLGFGGFNITRDASGTPVRYYSTAGMMRKVGASWALHSGGGQMAFSASATNRNSFCLHFIKIGTNIIMVWVGPTTNHVNSCKDVSENILTGIMDTTATISPSANIGGNTLSYANSRLSTGTIGQNAIGSFTIAANEAGVGYLNAFVAYWSAATPLNISEIQILRST